MENLNFILNIEKYILEIVYFCISLYRPASKLCQQTCLLSPVMLCYAIVYFLIPFPDVFCLWSLNKVGPHLNMYIQEKSVIGKNSNINVNSNSLDGNEILIINTLVLEATYDLVLFHCSYKM